MGEEHESGWVELPADAIKDLDLPEGDAEEVKGGFNPQPEPPGRGAIGDPNIRSFGATLKVSGKNAFIKVQGGGL